MIQDQELTDQLRDLAHGIAHRYGLTLQDLRGTSRKPNVVEARAEFAYEGYRTGASYPQLGAVIRKHHSTLLMGARRWKAMLNPATAGRAI